MSKFKVKMKITGFEMEIEGSRDDVPNITQALTRQLAGMLQPPTGIVEPPVTSPVTVLPSISEALPVEEVKPESVARKRTRARTRRPVQSNGVEDVEATAIDFRHAPELYGNPVQAWTTANKALWTLYVIGEMVGEKELSAKRITLSFNKHFRQAKEIIANNVTRDLGKLRLKKPVLVSEDTTRTPSVWYLTDEGIRAAQNLVAEALGRDT
ncbi:hypothetical protein [Paraburkholderia sp. BL25I1N1]|uniref:hypothetical protein n=1 Tax=Paraburkholderia sp. BL25I1N1 TaxID=1938804 RepID=UPI000D078842|nr:hypothetical protein [Paraburkholderia sp. BL25I1N1]PRX95870.1 hypothetical protein B0G73_13278 [Paraburkholderia sp. BL25I1N1]